MWWPNPTRRIRTLRSPHSKRHSETKKIKVTCTCPTFSGWPSWSEELLGPDRLPFCSSRWLCREKSRMRPWAAGAEVRAGETSLLPRSQWTAPRRRTYTTSTLEHCGPGAITCRLLTILGWIPGVVVKHMQRSSLTMAATGPAGVERETGLWAGCWEISSPASPPWTFPHARDAAAAWQAGPLRPPGASGWLWALTAGEGPWRRQQQQREQQAQRARRAGDAGGAAG